MQDIDMLILCLCVCVCVCVCVYTYMLCKVMIQYFKGYAGPAV